MPDTQIDTATDLYCILGDPVAHSMSPVMHNRAFAHRRINAVYLAFEVSDLAAAVAGIRSLGIKGASITLPHKSRIMDLLDAVDPAAAAIGAVNTIVQTNGRLVGKNSDSAGALDALRQQTAIEQKAALIIGAGGAARAIGFGVLGEGGHVTITNRSTAPGEQLAADLDVDFRPLPEIASWQYDILINTTPVGMSPAVEASPVPSTMLTPGMVVMDIVYNPRETLLLKTAARAGCKTIDGLAMFVNQGARQFEWWTGEKAPVAIMRQAVIEQLA